MTMEHVIKVPATTANIGPGFDCLGMALQMYNTLTIRTAETYSMSINGEGKGDIPTGESNLVYQSYLRTFEVLGKPAEIVKITQDNTIPTSRGLGSSANAVVGGILCALAISGQQWRKEQLLSLANQIEGHPDNVAPCIYGGFTVSMCEGNHARCISLPVDEQICPVAIIPGFELNTKQSRAVLPTAILFEDAVYNVSHAAYTVAAIASRDYSLLRDSVKDRMHQQYRAAFIPVYDDIMKKCEDMETAAYLSGAGPSLMALMPVENAPYFMKEMNRMLGDAWRVVQLAVDNEGARIEHNQNK